MLKKTPRGFELVERAPGVTLEQVQAATDAGILSGDEGPR